VDGPSRPFRQQPVGRPRRLSRPRASERLTAPFTFDDCARRIVDVLDGLGIDTTHFVGNSWGGMIGATFAANFPDRIGRAVLMNCTASPAGARQKLENPPLVNSLVEDFPAG
jgi:pimeloyl-ACP methyl ester carboxylesterase